MNDKMPDRKELELYIPQRNDGWFYCKMVSDPETMAYNAPWFPPDGCIPNAEDEWEELYNNWNIPDSGRFYAYLRRITDGRFVGDVNYHYDPERDWYDIKIIAASWLLKQSRDQQHLFMSPHLQLCRHIIKLLHGY